MMTDQQSEDARTLPMRSSATIAALVVALSKAQGIFPEIGKDKRADIATKSGSRYSYRYADFRASWRRFASRSARTSSRS